MMRLCGVIKITVLLLLDFMLSYSVLGVGTAAILTAGLALCAWLGEYIALLKDGAINLKELNDHERSCLMRAHECLAEDVKRVSGFDIAGLKLHVIPSDNMNAYAYGFHHVAVTRSVLNSCDGTTLCAILGHELSHILRMDAVFHRLIFANITLVIVGLMVGSFISVSFLWILFVLLCAFGICGGFFSMVAFHGISKLMKGTFHALQHLVLFLYQTVMGLVSRGCEFRADAYSCQLGYGPQLTYFLTRFVEGRESRQNSLNEILYASHPATYKRVLRIQQHSPTNSR